jgi:hypothetical protein
VAVIDRNVRNKVLKRVTRVGYCYIVQVSVTDQDGDRIRLRRIGARRDYLFTQRGDTGAVVITRPLQDSTCTEFRVRARWS